MGLLPLCATTVVEPWQRERLPYTTARYFARLRRMPHLRQDIHPTGPGHYGVAERGIIALVRPDRLRRILSRILDEDESLSSSQNPSSYYFFKLCAKRLSAY